MPLMTGSNWIQLKCISDNFRLRQLNEVTKKGQSRNCVNPHLTPRCSVTVFICLRPPAVEQDWTCLSMMLIILRRNSDHSDHRPMLTFCSLLIKGTDVYSLNLGGQGKLLRRTGVSSVSEQSDKYFNYSGFCKIIQLKDMDFFAQCTILKYNFTS